MHDCRQQNKESEHYHCNSNLAIHAFAFPAPVQRLVVIHFLKVQGDKLDSSEMEDIMQVLTL